MIITIDSGNSSIKIGYFENNKLVKTERVNTVEQAAARIPEGSVYRVIISSVSRKEEYFHILKTKDPHYYFLNSSTKTPINNLYGTPDTLGMDRLAAVAGAKYLFPGDDCLVIDIGTCITYDFVDRENNYLGGSISPGLSIRFKGLHTFTARLPEISLDQIHEGEIKIIGKNTKEAILSGVVLGVIAEMEGIIQNYKNNYPGIKTVICGGESHFFETKIKPSIFAVPELVHWGLFTIFNYNESEK